jgi:hypothetical protein
MRDLLAKLMWQERVAKRSLRQANAVLAKHETWRKANEYAGFQKTTA